MFRYIISLGVLSILVIVAGGNRAQACTVSASVYAETDWDLPLWSNTYDPCDGWMTWKVKFTRNEQQDCDLIISFEVEGTDVYETYNSRHYSPGTSHSFSGTIYFGSSDEHCIFMDRTTSPDVCFGKIAASTTYNTVPGN